MSEDSKDVPQTVSEQPLTPARRFRTWRESLGEEAAFSALIDYIGEGGHLPAFARENAFSLVAVTTWIDSDKDRKGLYARVREERSHVYAEMILDVSRRDCTTPVMDSDGHLVGTRVDAGKVQQAKLEADNLKWIAQKLMPKVYGEKIEATINDVREASNDQLAKELRSLGLGEVAAAMLGENGGGSVRH